MYGNEKEVGEGIRVVRRRPRRRLRHQQAEQRRAPSRRRPARVRPDAGGPRLRPRRPVPHPLAAADALRRRLRLDLEGPRGVLPRRAGPLDRRLELHPAPPAPPRPRDRGHPGRQPGRGAPVLHQRRGAGVRRRARHRDRGVVADRPGRRCSTTRRSRRSPSGSARARPRSRCAGTCSWATSSSRSRSRRSAMQANFEIFDFELTDEDLALISAPRPGRGRAYGPEPRHVRHDPRLSEAMRDGRHPPGCRPVAVPG